MTMINVPALVLLGVAAVCGTYLVLAVGVRLVVRFIDSDEARGFARSLALGSVGVFLAYVVGVVVWFVLYEMERQLGYAFGTVIILTLPLALFAPPAIGGALFYRSRPRDDSAPD